MIKTRTLHPNTLPKIAEYVPTTVRYLNLHEPLRDSPEYRQSKYQTEIKISQFECLIIRKKTCYAQQLG